jgi:hypothetical protein
LLNALHCYQHQACAHPGWDSSGARAFCQAVQQRLIRRLPGYLDGPWAITTASIPARGADADTHADPAGPPCAPGGPVRCLTVDLARLRVNWPPPAAI